MRSFFQSARPWVDISQPVWACQSPLKTLRIPPPSTPTWGLCGSPSSSVWAWCLRWSATQAIAGPCTAIEPSMANVYSIGFEVWKERWVRRRWKPTVIPTAVSKYMTAAMIRSAGVTRLFQSSTIAVIVATKGITTAPRLAAFSVRVISPI